MPRDLKKKKQIKRNEMNTVNREKKLHFTSFFDRKIHYFIYENEKTKKKS